MKKLLTSLMVLALVVTSITILPKKVEAGVFNHYTYSKLNGIKVTWKKKKGAKKFRIYRLVRKNDFLDDEVYPTRSDFKKYKTTKKRSFLDKKTKKGRYYSYFVDVVNKKGKVIATSWMENCDMAVKGLAQPVVSNAGYGEDHVNTPHKIYLYISPGEGYTSGKMKYKLYRKVAGAKKYKKIRTAKYPKGLTDEYCDKTVKPGKTYYYKVKSFLKKGKKKYASIYSDKCEISAVKFKGKYKVESITKAGVYTGKSMEAIIKFSNGQKYNGRTFLKGKTYYNSDGKVGSFIYDMNILEYSKDNKIWIDARNKSVEIPTNGSVYIKFEIRTTKEEDNKIYYAGSDGVNYSESYISDGNGEDYFIAYNGPGFGDTYGGFDLLKGTGSAYQDWD